MRKRGWKEKKTKLVDDMTGPETPCVSAVGEATVLAVLQVLSAKFHGRTITNRVTS